jgi:hypothetical protein
MTAEAAEHSYVAPTGNSHRTAEAAEHIFTTRPHARVTEQMKVMNTFSEAYSSELQALDKCNMILRSWPLQ